MFRYFGNVLVLYYERNITIFFTGTLGAWRKRPRLFCSSGPLTAALNRYIGCCTMFDHMFLQSHHALSKY